VGLEGVEVAAQGLGVLALLEDREPVAAGGDKAVGRDGVGDVPVYRGAVREGDARNALPGGVRRVVGELEAADLQDAGPAVGAELLLEDAVDLLARELARPETSRAGQRTRYFEGVRTGGSWSETWWPSGGRLLVFVLLYPLLPARQASEAWAARRAPVLPFAASLPSTASRRSGKLVNMPSTPIEMSFSISADSLTV